MTGFLPEADPSRCGAFEQALSFRENQAAPARFRPANHGRCGGNGGPAQSVKESGHARGLAIIYGVLTVFGAIRPRRRCSAMTSGCMR